MDDQNWKENASKIKDTVVWSLVATIAHFVALVIGNAISMMLYMIKDIAEGVLVLSQTETGYDLLYEGRPFSQVDRYIYEPLSIGTIIAAPLVILAVILFCRASKLKFTEFTRVKKLPAVQSALGFAIGLFIYLPVAMIISNTFLRDVSQSASEAMELMFDQTPFWLLLLSTAICAPLIEELTFRGFVQSKLMKLCRPMTAIVIQAVLFGLFHMNLQQFVYASLLGLLFGLLRYWSDSIWPSVFAHIGFNLFSVLLAELNKHEDWMFTKWINQTPELVLVFASLIIFAAAFYLFKVLSRKQRLKSSGN